MILTTGRCWLLAGCIFTASLPVQAATDIAEEPGFSGFFRLGVASASAASNQIAIESGNDTIDSIADAPDSASTVMPAIGLSLTYTFDNLATELFLGDSVEDFVRFDFATLVGLRHKVEGVGIFQLSGVQTPFAIDVWADPYLAGVERDETERSVNGFRLQWGKIMDSGFDFRISSRTAKIDDEDSGNALVADNIISAAEQQLLDRNGEINRASVIYNWDRGRGQLLSLIASYQDYDLEGKAMAFDGYSLQLSNVSALNPRLRLASNLVLGQYRHDAVNPIYGERNDKNLAAVTLTLFLSDLFGARGWIGNATLAYAREDNAIDFYDTTASFVSLGVIRRF